MKKLFTLITLGSVALVSADQYNQPDFCMVSQRSILY